MAKAARGSTDLLAKVVLVGVPGAGKASIVKAVAAEYAHSSVRVGELGEARIFRTEFFWPEALADGNRLRVRLYAMSGHSHYNAHTELLMGDADGIVFVANLAREAGEAAKEAFQTLLFNARHLGYDLTAMPVALHYHRLTMAAAHDPGALDELLGVPSGSVRRFVTGPGESSGLRGAVEWVVSRIAGTPPPAEAQRGARRGPEALAAT